MHFALTRFPLPDLGSLSMMKMWGYTSGGYNGLSALIYNNII
jgi:hypothetical protein